MNMNAPHQSRPNVETASVAAADRLVTEEYFRSFNQNQFEQTAALFSEDGELLPPFESPIVGEQAILAYLEKEAGNITAFPERWERREGESDRPHIVVTGKVNAIIFKVNVAWYFILSSGDETSAPSQIERVRIKLLASPKELLGMQSSKG